jgi:hypothetical protein
VNHLTIKDFGVLKSVQIEVPPFLVLVGQGATGKSLVAKVLQFCQSVLCDKQGDPFAWRGLFLTTFDVLQFLQDEPFRIEYTSDDSSVVITNEGGELAVRREGNDDIYPVYVPAERAMVMDVPTGILRKCHGMIGEFANLWDTIPYVFDSNPPVRYLAQIGEVLGAEYLNTSYTYGNNESWFKGNLKPVEGKHLSAGQKDVFPLLLTVLCPRTSRASFIVEEPEGRLFPSAQKGLVDLLAQVNLDQGHGFVITTHSPYILVALNNLIMAGNVLDEKPDVSRAEIEGIIGGNFPLRYDDVAAYVIRDGVAVSIKDDETRLIGASVVDDASDELEAVFGQLLALAHFN